MFIVAAALIASAATAPERRDLSVKQLQTLCESSEEGDQAACSFYILGAFQGLSLAGAAESAGGKFIEKRTGKHFCVPDNLPATEMRKRVLAQMTLDLQRYPADAQLPAVAFIAAMIEVTYPCR